MILKTLDESMEKAKKFENLTKTSEINYLFRNMNIEKTVEEEFEMYQNNSYNTEECNAEISKEDAEILEYITENPNEIVQIFEDKNMPSTGLPFFKSIDYKLSEIFNV